jgi:hypothetical protein
MAAACVLGRERARGYRFETGKPQVDLTSVRSLLCRLETVPQVRHTFGMTATVKLDGSNRIVLSRDLRRAAGIPRWQKLKVSATPGRVVLEVEPNPGKVVKRGKLKVWTGQVPSTPIEEAVDVVRHYER